MRKLILTAAFLSLGSAAALAAPQAQAAQPAATQQQNQQSTFMGVSQTEPQYQASNASPTQDCAVGQGQVWMHTGRMPWRAGQGSW